MFGRTAVRRYPDGLWDTDEDTIIVVLAITLLLLLIAGILYALAELLGAARQVLFYMHRQARQQSRQQEQDEA